MNARERVHPTPKPLRVSLRELRSALFPRSLRRSLALVCATRAKRSDTRWRLQTPGVLLARLRGIRSERALTAWMLDRSVKDLLSIEWWVNQLVRRSAKLTADAPAHQRICRSLGRRPTR